MKLRVLAGTLVAFLAMSMAVFALSIAPWFALGVDGVLKPGVFDTRPAFDAYAVFVGILGALFSGRLCAPIFALEDCGALAGAGARVRT